MKLLAFGPVAPRGAAVPRRRLGRAPHQPDWAGWSDGMSFRLTLLCWVKAWVGLQEPVELAGDVADQAASDLALVLPWARRRWA